MFEIQWQDNVKARDLSILEGDNYIKQPKKKAIRSQVAIYNYYKEN